MASTRQKINIFRKISIRRSNKIEDNKSKILNNNLNHTICNIPQNFSMKTFTLKKFFYFCDILISLMLCFIYTNNQSISHFKVEFIKIIEYSTELNSIQIHPYEHKDELNH